MSVDELRVEALERMRSATDKAQRHGRVAFPPGFIRGAGVAPPPLARLVQGGRGGEVRLKLYLCISMMATSKPYDLRTAPTPRAWARLLALPPDTGPRRVSSNLRWLRDNKFILLGKRPLATPAIRLLSPMGNGIPYERPITQGRYVGVPVELWSQGWVIDLSATGLALLLVLLELQGGQTGPRYVTRHRREQYGLSPDTWTRARKELESHGLLAVARTPQGSDFDHQRLRNTYWVDLERLKAPAASRP